MHRQRPRASVTGRQKEPEARSTVHQVNLGAIPPRIEPRKQESVVVFPAPDLPKQSQDLRDLFKNQGQVKLPSANNLKGTAEEMGQKSRA